MQSQLEQMEKDFGIEWKEYRLDELFEVVGTKSLDSNAIEFLKSGINFIGRTFESNGIQGKIEKQDFEPNESFTITATVIGNYKYVKFQTEPYYCSQNINKLTPKKLTILKWSKEIAYYFVANIQKFVSQYDMQQGGYKLDDIKNHIVRLPTVTQNGKSQIAFDFIEKFMATLQAERLTKLQAYLIAAGLNDCTLTDDEQAALNLLDAVNFGKFNLEKLYGKSSRGRRLKSADRIDGKLPFVTAGETDTGISDYIGNEVHIFEENTVTIDMFGSSKYRNYKYGADDHVAVVHTETLSKFAALFLTTAIHKSSHAGQFDYSRNFYASDADELNISLPINPDNTPNYDYMHLVISAMQKNVIKNVVDYLDMRIEKTVEILQ